jgi:hypothetical protein
MGFLKWLFARVGANGHEKNRTVLRIVEPRSGETGEELIRVLRIVESRRDEAREESKGFFDVVLTQPIPK